MDINAIIEKALPTTIGVIVGSSATIILFFIGKYLENRKDQKDRKLKIYSKVNALTYNLVNTLGGKDYHKIYNNYYIALERIVILPDHKENAKLESRAAFDRYLDKRESSMQLLTQLNEYVYEYSYLTKRKDIETALHKILESNLDSDFDYKFGDAMTIPEANRILNELLHNVGINLNINITPKIRELLLLLDKK